MLKVEKHFGTDLCGLERSNSIEGKAGCKEIDHQEAHCNLYVNKTQ
jgi:hypothetical protein